MQNEITTPYSETPGYKFGVAVLTYFGGLLVAILSGCIVGFGFAWFSIWINSVIEVLVIFCAVIPAGIARAVTSRTNIMTGLLGAAGAFVTILVFYLTLDYKELTWSDSESIWDKFWLYCIPTTLFGAFVGFYKGKEK